MKKILACIFVGSLLIGVSYSQVSLDSSLVASYYFNSNFADSSGHSYDAYNMGVYFGPDRFGNSQSAAYFDGWSYLTFPEVVRFQPNTPSTVSFWMKTTNYERITLFEQRIGSGTPDNLNFGISFNYPFPQYVHYVYPNYNGTPFAYTSYIVFTDLAITGDWHHFVFTKDLEQNKMSVYQDKVLLGYRPITDVSFVVNGPLIMGRNMNFEFFFSGYADDVKIYNRVLNQEEIDSLYSEVVVVNTSQPMKTEFNVYPNPTKDLINFDFPDYLGQVKTVEIFSEEGKLLRTIPTNVNRIDLSEYGTGKYIIVLTNRSGYKSSSMVTKM